MSAIGLRWEIWGKYLNYPAIMVQRLEKWEKPDEMLAAIAERNCDKWQFFVESRPSEHPYARLQRRLEGKLGSRGRAPLKLMLEKGEGNPKGWSDPTVIRDFGSKESPPEIPVSEKMENQA